MSREDGMAKALHKQARSTIANIPEEPLCPRVERVGAELELFLFHRDGTLVSDEEKRTILGTADGDSFGYELGAAAVEINPGPINLHKEGFQGWFNQLHKLEKALHKSAKARKVKVGRCGTVPWASTKNIARTDMEKYRLVPDFHNKRRPSWAPRNLGGAFVADAAIVGLCNAFQFSVEACSLNDGIDKLNRLLFISPMAVALSANARVFDCIDTGWADARFEVWRRSHETRTQKELSNGSVLRIGLPKNYYRNLEHYLQDICSYPFIISNPEAALGIGIGLNWRDARLKFIDGSPVVEFRPVSTQPTLEEDIAIGVFVVGRLLWSQQNEEVLPPMAVVNRNKLEAEMRGLNAKLALDGTTGRAQQLLREELSRATKGLESEGILDEQAKEGLAALSTRIKAGITLSERQSACTTLHDLLELVEVKRT